MEIKKFAPVFKYVFDGMCRPLLEKNGEVLYLEGSSANNYKDILIGEVTWVKWVNWLMNKFEYACTVVKNVTTVCVLTLNFKNPCKEQQALPVCSCL